MYNGFCCCECSDDEPCCRCELASVYSSYIDSGLPVSKQDLEFVERWKKAKGLTPP
jgi:hypothetical protein